MQASNGAVLQVQDVKKAAGGQVFVHHCTVTSGSVATGATLHAAVDESFRRRTRANHTATHLLQAALKLVLGDAVAQQGSQVRCMSPLQTTSGWSNLSTCASIQSTPARLTAAFSTTMYNNLSAPAKPISAQHLSNSGEPAHTWCMWVLALYHSILQPLRTRVC